MGREVGIINPGYKKLWSESEGVLIVFSISPVRFVLIACVVFLSSCYMPEEIKRSRVTSESLYDHGILTSHQKIMGSMSLHYVTTASDKELVIVFIHGTPGDWTMFGPQMNDSEMQAKAALVAIDRPGWGGSAFVDGGAEHSLEKQVEYLAPLLRLLRQKHSSLVVVGHSLGGTLAPLLGYKYPELVDGVIVIAGDLSAERMQLRWYNHVLSWLWVNSLVPKTLCKANEEVLGLSRSLKKLEQYWPGFEVPMLVVQGTKDHLVDPMNADYAEKLLTGNRISVEKIPGANHLVHLSHSKRVNRLIFHFSQELSR
ncbi:alpha/beta hydrolase [Teredinibacter sp. KSP-S5-2]|uniref:alpha/beta fold hydrolase n=1 Tax=Teredinibacter sp. KSP-S5-2 TaxID=3034506 RepID=UPI002934FF7C|nr:alpha/beta hydrolase [Teredinibacter sp. KSP-S5-2]WNO09459.1 alpha/beta hydrolase [Teredinibacter sp. KSP-S5-2]